MNSIQIYYYIKWWVIFWGCLVGEFCGAEITFILLGQTDRFSTHIVGYAIRTVYGRD